MIQTESTKCSVCLNKRYEISFRSHCIHLLPCVTIYSLFACARSTEVSARYSLRFIHTIFLLLLFVLDRYDRTTRRRRRRQWWRPRCANGLACHCCPLPTIVIAYGILRWVTRAATLKRQHAIYFPNDSPISEIVYQSAAREPTDPRRCVCVYDAHARVAPPAHWQWCGCYWCVAYSPPSAWRTRNLHRRCCLSNLYITNNNRSMCNNFWWSIPSAATYEISNQHHLSRTLHANNN